MSEQWLAMPLDSPLCRGPEAPVAAPVLGRLDSLPFGLLTWEDFERLQWRTMRDVLGLREAQIYGDRGQAQYGLDVVALAVDGSVVALQSKRYQRFGPADLDAAVEKFQATDRPFSVDHLIIGVGCDAKSTKFVERLAELRRAVKPLKLDVWDRTELSGLLKNVPEIVIEFFGMPTAEAFCLPFELAPTLVPTADAVRVREALARTPEAVTGAQDQLDEADQAVDDPSRALDLVESAQAKLRSGGFHGHAAHHESRRTGLLVALGRSGDAARQILEEFWAALDRGLTTTAQAARHRLAELSRSEQNSRVDEALVVADVAIALYFNPLAQLPTSAKLLLGDTRDQVRLAVLAAEIALADDQKEWLTGALPTLRLLSGEATADSLLSTRLRLLVAECTDDWTDLLGDARRLRLGHALGALVAARYARYCAIRERFAEADMLWDEAAGDACLAKNWADASTWVFSRRAFRNRWQPFTGEQFLPMQTALSAMGPSAPLVDVDGGAYEDALEQLRGGKLRAAAISAQRALRDAVTTSDWVGEGKARRVLAAILGASGEPERAAAHLIRAGDVTALEELGREWSSHFLDVSADLAAGNYWTVGAAYRLLAIQADLIPDDLVPLIAARAVEELEAMDAGRLVDLQSFGTSRYLGAMRVLAGVTHRVTETQAATVLAHFRQQPPVEINHYRFHDESEAIATARIASAWTGLRDAAVRHLVALLARSQTARNDTTLDVVERYLDLARADLQTLAVDGNRWAKEMLAVDDPAAVSGEDVEAAFERLSRPLVHVPGVFTRGTGAIGDSLLIGGADPSRLAEVIAELLRRAEDSHVGSADRNDYLLAAANLAPEVGKTDRERLFDAALRIAISSPPSLHDDFEGGFTHELGGMRIRRSDQDSRNRALYLAARLAGDQDQRDAVKRQSYALLGDGTESDYWPTRALQVLGPALREDIGFLAGQGWALRSLAGIIWSESGDSDHVGLRLADDPDVRVRRSLARALAGAVPAAYQIQAREHLEQDPCYSVRMAVRGADEPTEAKAPTALDY